MVNKRDVVVVVVVVVDELEGLEKKIMDLSEGG
jgi:hypothetical protein